MDVPSNCQGVTEKFRQPQGNGGAWHTALQWGGAFSPSHRGSSCRRRATQSPGIQCLQSLHCCGGQSLRPAEFTAIPMSVTWRGLGTLKEYEPHQGQLMQAQLLTVALNRPEALSQGPLQFLGAQRTAHMWE